MATTVVNITDDITSKLKKHGYVLGNKIGSGENGSTFQLKNKDKSIMKITGDEAEFLSSNHIKGKKFQNVCNIYRCFKLKDIDYFFIEQEKLNPIPKNEVTDLISLLENNTTDKHEKIAYLLKSMDFKNPQTILRNTKSIVTDIIDKKRDFNGKEINNNNNIDAQYTKQLVDEFKDDAYRALVICYVYHSNYENLSAQLVHMNKQIVYDLSQLVNGLMELISNDVEYHDIDQTNILKKSNGQLALIDFGYSKSPKENFPVLENIFKEFRVYDRKEFTTGGFKDYRT